MFSKYQSEPVLRTSVRQLCRVVALPPQQTKLGGQVFVRKVHAVYVRADRMPISVYIHAQGGTRLRRSCIGGGQPRVAKGDLVQVELRLWSPRVLLEYQITDSSRTPQRRQRHVHQPPATSRSGDFICAAIEIQAHGHALAA